NVNEAAYATGFSSPPYFSKCFKAVYNITPTEYQEKG
ncbi:helix-turn-helix domain-containing protein, partial [Parabacteroides goldsteinii]